MDVNFFIDIFLKELEQNRDLRDYHRLINSKSSFLFRKAYFAQRLEYLSKHAGNGNLKILDLGCGYGTSSIFLGLSGHQVVGTTLEYYYEKIAKRLDFWSRYFNTEHIEFRYENIFDSDYPRNEFDMIIAQDTLHHLEPIDHALKIAGIILKEDGKLMVSEENGNNLFCRMKHFRERGFKRIIEIYDEKLGKKILFGNENTRSLTKWNQVFLSNSFEIDPESIEFIRFFPPFLFKKMDYDRILSMEQKLWKRSGILKDFFFFGINFTAGKRKKIK